MLNIEKLPHKRLTRWIAIAVCVALLFTGVCIFLFAERYETEPGAMVGAIDYLLDFPWADGGFSHAWGMPLMLSFNHESLENSVVTWNVIAEDGDFYLDSEVVRDRVTEDDPWPELAYLGNNFVVDNDTFIQWINDYLVFNGGISTQRYEGKSTYVDFVLRADDHIVGYAVVEIVGLPNKLEGFEDDEVAYYDPVLIASNFYPMVDGKFQNVTEEYINWQIKKAKLFR